jgi:hypothetical protein
MQQRKVKVGNLYWLRKQGVKVKVKVEQKDRVEGGTRLVVRSLKTKRLMRLKSTRRLVEEVPTLHGVVPTPRAKTPTDKAGLFLDELRAKKTEGKVPYKKFVNATYRAMFCSTPPITRKEAIQAILTALNAQRIHSLTSEEIARLKRAYRFNSPGQFIEEVHRVTVLSGTRARVQYIRAIHKDVFGYNVQNTCLAKTRVYYQLLRAFGRELSEVQEYILGCRTLEAVEKHGKCADTVELMKLADAYNRTTHSRRTNMKTKTNAKVQVEDIEDEDIEDIEDIEDDEDAKPVRKAKKGKVAAKVTAKKSKRVAVVEEDEEDEDDEDAKPVRKAKKGKVAAKKERKWSPKAIIDAKVSEVSCSAIARNIMFFHNVTSPMKINNALKALGREELTAGGVGTQAMYLAKPKYREVPKFSTKMDKIIAAALK